MGFTRFYWVFTWVLLGFTGIVLEWRRRYGGKPPSFFLPEVLLSVFYRVFTEFLGGRDEVTRRVHRSTRAARVALERPLVRRPPRRPLIESTEAAARRSVFLFFFLFFYFSSFYVLFYFHHFYLGGSAVDRRDRFLDTCERVADCFGYYEPFPCFFFIRLLFQ